MADAIVLIDDLFFQAKLFETAKLTGITLEIAATGEQLLKAATAHPDALVIVDLNARQGALDAVEQLCKSGAEPAPLAGVGCGLGLEPGVKSNARGNPRRVIAFLSHVQTELAERPRAPGCQNTMPPSHFTHTLTPIFPGP